MNTVRSTDETIIAYDESGSGQTLICIPPAFGLRDAYQPLADELADDYHVVRYDRRGRGDSTDAIKPQDVASYRIEREIEDLAAVIAAVDDDVAVLGYSSGARLALEAAAAGVPMARIALYEPPYSPDETEPDHAVVAKLAELIAAGRPGDAVATFQIEGVGIPAEMVEGMRTRPGWAALEAVAQTVVYDAAITAEPRVSDAVRSLDQPVTVLAGAQTWPFLITAAHYAAEVIDNASFVEVPGGANHQLDPVATAAVLRTVLG